MVNIQIQTYQQDQLWKNKNKETKDKLESVSILHALVAMI
jgi:hypothetical protein